MDGGDSVLVPGLSITSGSGNREPAVRSHESKRDDNLTSVPPTKTETRNSLELAEAQDRPLRLPLVSKDGLREELVLLRRTDKTLRIRIFKYHTEVPYFGAMSSIDINTDQAILTPSYLLDQSQGNVCVIKEDKNQSSLHMFDFVELEDAFKFQQAFTDYRVVHSVPNVKTYLSYSMSLWRGENTQYQGSVQLWTPEKPTGLSARQLSLEDSDTQFQERQPKNKPVTVDHSVPFTSAASTNPPVASQLPGYPNLEELGLPTLVFSLVANNGGRSQIYSLLRIPLEEGTAISEGCDCRNFQKWCSHTTIESASRLDAYQQRFFQLEKVNLLTVGSQSRQDSFMIKRKMQWLRIEFKSRNDKEDFEASFESLKMIHAVRVAKYRQETDAVDPSRNLPVRAGKTPAFRAAQFNFTKHHQADHGQRPEPIPQGRQNLPPYTRYREDDQFHKYSGKVDKLHEVQQSNVVVRSENPQGENENRSSRDKVKTPSIDALFEMDKQALKNNHVEEYPDERQPSGEVSLGYDAPLKETLVQETQHQRLVDRRLGLVFQEIYRKLLWRRIRQKIIIFMLWQSEWGVSPPLELWASPTSFKFTKSETPSVSDKVKTFAEHFTGQEWNWWPFDPPINPVAKDTVRIRWQCTCGDVRWVDASKDLAQRCQRFVTEHPTTDHQPGPSNTGAHMSPSGNSVPGSFPLNTFTTGSNITNNNPAIQSSQTNPSANSEGSTGDTYVLFCIYQRNLVRHAVIEASKYQNDEAFFEELRKAFRRLRGFWQYWLSPFQFDHCEFWKFTRFYVNELARAGKCLPLDPIYQYRPRPPGIHPDPPIQPDEFRRRFYTDLSNPCGRGEALERIPKRQTRFQINLHVDGYEDMWGLLVELRPSFLVALVWGLVITAGGWGFLGWWISGHKDDLQTAAVPVMLIMTILMTYLAVNQR